jgi:hypothetical protein
MKNFDSIEEALNVDTEVVEDDKIEPRKNQLEKSDKNDSEKDYEYSRANLYSLVEKGQEAVKDLEQDPNKGPTNVTNALFVGSTAELSKLIKNQNKDDK